jgi:hypothetical protein
MWDKIYRGMLRFTVGVVVAVMIELLRFLRFL